MLLQKNEADERHQKQTERYLILRSLTFWIFVTYSILLPIHPIIIQCFNFALLIMNIYFRRGILKPHFLILIIALTSGLIVGYEMQAVILSLLFFTFDFSYQLIMQSLQVMKKIKNLTITITFVFSLFTYLMTFLYRGRENEKSMFDQFGWTNLTLLQVLSGDAWGELGRSLEDDYNHFIQYAKVTLCIFIFLMTYFYMNLCMGLVLESLQEISMFNDVRGMEGKFKEKHRKKTESKLDDCLLGRTYQYFIFGFCALTIVESIYTQFNESKTLFGIIIGSVDDFVYTLHFVIILFRSGRIFKYERSSIIMMTIHFLSGPLSLGITLFFNSTLGSLFNLTKLATTPIVKGIFKGTIYIIPTVYASLLTLITMTLIFAGFFNIRYYLFLGIHQQKYFASTWGSFYTFFQLLTFDDWNSFILPIFQDKAIIPFVAFPCYIFISNFILLNTFIAISCEYFMEINPDSVLKRREAERKKSRRQDLLKLVLQEYQDLSKLKFFTKQNVTKEEQNLMNHLDKTKDLRIQLQFQKQEQYCKLPYLFV